MVGWSVGHGDVTTIPAEAAAAAAAARLSYALFARGELIETDAREITTTTTGLSTTNTSFASTTTTTTTTTTTATPTRMGDSEQPTLMYAIKARFLTRPTA